MKLEDLIEILSKDRILCLGGEESEIILNKVENILSNEAVKRKMEFILKKLNKHEERVFPTYLAKVICELGIEKLSDYINLIYKAFQKRLHEFYKPEFYQMTILSVLSSLYIDSGSEGPALAKNALNILLMQNHVALAYFHYISSRNVDIGEVTEEFYSFLNRTKNSV